MPYHANTRPSQNFLTSWPHSAGLSHWANEFDGLRERSPRNIRVFTLFHQALWIRQVSHSSMKTFLRPFFTVLKLYDGQARVAASDRVIGKCWKRLLRGSSKAQTPKVAKAYKLLREAGPLPSLVAVENDWKGKNLRGLPCIRTALQWRSRKFNLICAN